MVDVSLDLIDKVRERRPVGDLLADRHYSYKEWSRWAHQLWLRGVRPVVDLRADEHGFRPYDGTKVAASWPHCPGTPNRLAELPRPGTGASPAARAAFEDAITERQAYAMRRVKSHVPDGASRWERVRFVTLPYLLPLATFVALMQLMDNFRVLEPIVGFSAAANATSLSYLIYNDLQSADTPLFGSAAATSVLTTMGVVVLLAPVLARTWRDVGRRV